MYAMHMMLMTHTHTQTKMLHKHLFVKYKKSLYACIYMYMQHGINHAVTIFFFKGF